jgi:hypothetical protein
MMASSLPLVTTGLRCPPSMSSDGHGGTRLNGGGQRNEDPLNWCAWAHQGHHLWVGMPDSFWVFTYKVERCPFLGNHVWMSCPYAHKGEHARRRDPRNFPYTATSCPEYEESKRQLRLAGSSVAPTCPRGLRCGYAHSIFETWLHPTGSSPSCAITASSARAESASSRTPSRSAGVRTMRCPLSSSP